MIIRRDSVETISFDGLEIRDYTAGCDTSSSLAEITVPVGGRHSEAWSKRSDKYYYVIAGQIRFMLDRAEHDLAAGDSCLVPQGSHFAYENRTEKPTTLLLIHTPSFDLDSEVFADGT